MGLLDHDNLYSIASYLTKEIQKDSGVTFDTSVEDMKDYSLISRKYIDSTDYKKAIIRRSSSRSLFGDVSVLCMIVYFVIMFQFAMNMHRTIDGKSLSFWKQEPVHLFEESKTLSSNSIYSRFSQFMSNAGMKNFKDGLFGRKMDPFHDRFISWGLEVLPMHLISGLLLVIIRRVPWINRNWSPAAITVGVSLCHIFCLHGLSAFWSLGSASINFLVCRIAVTLAQHHSPSKSRWLIWGCNLLLIAMNNFLEIRFDGSKEDIFPSIE